MHQLKEVDMRSAKLDLLMKKLDDKAEDKREVMHVYDSHMTLSSVEILDTQAITALRCMRM